MEAPSKPRLTPWRAAERAYYAHHAKCNACKAAGIRVGELERCEEGAALWKAYSDQPLPHVLGGPRQKVTASHRTA